MTTSIGCEESRLNWSEILEIILFLEKDSGPFQKVSHGDETGVCSLELNHVVLITGSGLQSSPLPNNDGDLCYS